MIDLRSISRRALLAATSSSTFALLQSRFASAQDLASDAANRAVEISQLEAAEDFDAIYDLLHPDAQAIIPREVVVGWYRDFLANQDAGVLTVTGVSIVSWTWPVTGKTYEATAEVSFIQPYTQNGVTSDAADIVRLVDPGDGRGPRWFFGRSREFVDEQIARHGVSVTQPQSGTGEYEFVELGVLPGLDFSSPEAINNDGLVAGTCFLRGDPGFAGFVWENGAMQALADRTGQPFNINFPHDVNAAGVIVGGSAEFEGVFTAFRIEGELFQNLGSIDDLPNAAAEAINDDGLIAGWVQGFMFGVPPREPASAVRWNGDGIARLDDNGASESRALGINAAGDIVGDARWGGARQAVIWIDGALKILPQFSTELSNDSALEINRSRTIIGRSTSNDYKVVRSWVWTPGDPAPTELAGPYQTAQVEARAINDTGWIVGTATDSQGNGVGLLWRDGGNVAVLTDLLPPNSGWQVSEANDINDRNEIAVTLKPTNGTGRFGAILRPR